MRQIIICVLALAAIVQAAAPVKPQPVQAELFEWPAEIVYKDKARDSRWLREQYASFASKLTVIDGQVIDLGYVYTQEPRLGQVTKLSGSVLQVVSDNSILLRYAILAPPRDPLSLPRTVYRILYVDEIPTAKLVDGNRWQGTVAGIGTHRYVDAYANSRTVLHCRPLPAHPEPISKPAFVAALRAGLKLAKWERRRIPRHLRGPYGDGYTYRRIPIE